MVEFPPGYVFLPWNYIIKQDAKPYQIIVKLPGLAASDIDVHGNARTALGRFAELDPLADKTPLEYSLEKKATKIEELLKSKIK